MRRNGSIAAPADSITQGRSSMASMRLNQSWVCVASPVPSSGSTMVAAATGVSSLKMSMPYFALRNSSTVASTISGRLFASSL